MQIGKRVIESRRGSTGNEANPWFAIDRVGETDESHGPVWFGELGWSGSWRFTIERTSSDQCRVIGGLNPFDFSYRLAPGESLETPPFFAGFTIGYLFYDGTHYFVHHFAPTSRWGKFLRRHHMTHHFADHDGGFGVSSPLRLSSAG